MSKNENKLSILSRKIKIGDDKTLDEKINEGHFYKGPPEHLHRPNR